MAVLAGGVTYAIATHYDSGDSRTADSHDKATGAASGSSAVQPHVNSTPAPDEAPAGMVWVPGGVTVVRAEIMGHPAAYGRVLGR